MVLNTLIMYIIIHTLQVPLQLKVTSKSSQSNIFIICLKDSHKNFPHKKKTSKENLLRITLKTLWKSLFVHLFQQKNKIWFPLTKHFTNPQFSSSEKLENLLLNFNPPQKMTDNEFSPKIFPFYQSFLLGKFSWNDSCLCGVIWNPLYLINCLIVFFTSSFPISLLSGWKLKERIKATTFFGKWQKSKSFMSVFVIMGFIFITAYPL
jgi:hypothetical protein